VELRDESLMAEKSNRGAVVILPVLLVGIVAGGLVLTSQGPEVPGQVPEQLTANYETPIVNQAIESGLASLPSDTPSLGRSERHLRLRLNGTPERSLEVAGGLFAIATKHLESGNSPEATRVAQVCADLIPGSLLAARCWLLCGEAAAMAAPDFPISIRYFERADAVLRDRLRRNPDENEALQLQATALQQLSQSEVRFDRHADAIRHLRELTGNAPVAQGQSPGDRLRAILALGQLLFEAGPIEEAVQELARAEEYGMSEEVPAAEALHALAGKARVLTVDPADFSYEALRRLWEARRFESLPEWFQIGDELTSAYYFHEPRQLADFELVSGKFLASLPAVLESLPSDSLQRAELESLYATNLLLAADAARSRSDTAEVARLVKLFESTFDGRDVKFTCPLDRPAQRLSRIGEIYRTTMTGHVKQLQKLQATGNIPPAL